MRPRMQFPIRRASAIGPTAVTIALLMLTIAATAAFAQETAEVEVSAAEDAAGVVASEGGLPDFSGAWTLNPELSDDPREVMRNAMSNAGGRGGRGGGMGGRGGGMGGRGGGSGVNGIGGTGSRTVGGDFGGERGESPRAEMSAAMKTLTIFHAEPELNVTDGRERTALYYTDGRDCEIWTERGQVVAKAVWTGNILRLDMKPQRGPARTEEYMIDPESGRLVVSRIVSLPQGDRKITIKSVYDRAE